MYIENYKKLFLVFMVLLLANLACGISNEGNLETAAAETVAVELTLKSDLSLSEAATENANEESNLLNLTMIPTITAITVGTPIPTATIAPTDETPCDVAAFVSDVTVPDGADFIPDENFTKTWRLKNVGTCTWTTAYDLVFFDGDQMNGPVSQPLINSGSVAPNQSVDISVDLSAPDSAGNAIGYWKLRNASNVIFELSNGDPFYVEIDVFEPTATPDTPIFLVTILPEIFIIGPNFTIESTTQWTCNTLPAISFRINNIGIYTIESMRITVEGPIGHILNSNIQNNPFKPAPSYAYPQCIQIGAASLATGNIQWVSTNLVTQPLPGSTGEVKITMCTSDNLDGFCTEKTYNFIW